MISVGHSGAGAAASYGAADDGLFHPATVHLPADVLEVERQVVQQVGRPHHISWARQAAQGAGAGTG